MSRRLLAFALVALSLSTTELTAFEASAHEADEQSAALTHQSIEQVSAQTLEPSRPQPLLPPAVGELAELEEACALAPVPTGRWEGRASDDEWIPGLYPAREELPAGKLALTFDDGPHPGRTPLILDELERQGWTGAFFITGHSVRANTYHLIQRMVAEGHTLANHGWRHDTRMARNVAGLDELEAYVASEFELTQIRVDLAMLATSKEDFRALDGEVFDGLRWSKHDRSEQLARMEGIRARHRAVLEARGYSEQDRPHTLGWVRPPGGNPYVGSHWKAEEREAFARAVNAQGMRMVMWDGGTGDSDPKLSVDERMDPKRVAKTATKAARSASREGGIYVAHDRLAPDATKAMLRAFARSGVEIVSLAELDATHGCSSL